MNREQILEMIDDTQIANMIINWHESTSDLEQNEIYNTLYHQEGVPIEDLNSVNIKWNF